MDTSDHMNGVPFLRAVASVCARFAWVAALPMPSTVISTGLSTEHRAVRRLILQPLICFWMLSVSLKTVKVRRFVVMDVPYVHAPPAAVELELFITQLWKW